MDIDELPVHTNYTRNVKLKSLGGERGGGEILISKYEDRKGRRGKDMIK